MEQVFSLVNKVLHRDQKTRRRALQIRTYKVIPLIAETGVIEFVANAETMLETLTRVHTKF